MGKWFQDKNFSTEKRGEGIKAPKGHRDINVRKIHSALGILLAAALIFQTVPFNGIVVSASESRAGLCEHHTEHTPDCGCREAAEGSLCTFVCEICRGGTDEVPEDNTDDNGINVGNSENLGTGNGDEVKEPDDGQEECICEERCTEDNGNGGCRINTDCPVCGAEDASLSDCKGKDVEDSTEDAEEDTDQPENTGLCRHHQEHDDACGYLPESEDSEGSPCTYACRIRPVEKLIAALPDAADITEDNAEEVRAQLDKILALFVELTEDEQEQIDLSRVYELQEALDGANAPKTVQADTDYQEASWNGSEVTYEGKTETCTLVENSTEAVTWTAGWYAVSGSVTISEPITVSGNVNLILTDGCDLTASKGIVVTTGNSLTIYVQSENGGRLNATGTADDNSNASAGIGGGTTSFDSGDITIHGGVINATGGYVNNSGGSGAGIGGGGSGSTDGGDSGAITIYNGVITAVGGELDYGNQIAAYHSGAGIGGGSSRNNSGGAGSSITIYGGTVTAKSQASNQCGAGIGGGGADRKGGAGNSIVIYGGNITATSDSSNGMGGAGIGGGGGGEGNGDGTVTISGGVVTAVGGKRAAGIGGGGGYQGNYNMSVIGGAGTVNITSGLVDAKGGAGNNNGDYAGAPIGNGGNANGTATVNKTTGIVFENGVGTVCGNVTFNGSYEVPAGYSLHIPAGNSLSGSGTLTGGGTFTADLSEDMISVPTNLYYDGTDRTVELQSDLSAEINKGIAICGQTFTVSGWTVAVSRTDDLHYTATYANESDNTKNFTKTITLQKSGTQFVGDGTVKTYKDSVACSDFTADDTITVKATPTATGAAPVKAAARLRGGPTAGQMAVYVGDTLVSNAAEANSDGSYTMTVNASDVLEQGKVEPNGGPVTLTAKFVGNDNMADAAGTVNVKISAVAKVVKGSTTTYVGNLDDAFKAENEGAIITLLADVTRTGQEYLLIGINCTLDLGGHTIFGNLDVSDYILTIVGKNVTIQGDGGISGTGNTKVLQTSGNVIIKGGTFSCEFGNCIFVTGSNASLSITGSEVRVENTGGYGLCIGNASSSVQLSAGTYSGEAGAIFINSSNSFTLGDLLNQTGQNRLAYYQGSTLVTEGLDGKALPGGAYTVEKCRHDYKYTHTDGTTNHSQSCPACGDTKTSETCSYVDGECACGSTLSVALTNTEKLVYDGNRHTPGVTVTLDGTELTAADYDVTYANSINAGVDTATVTVTGKGNYSFEIKKTFSIEKAEQEDFAVVAVTRAYEKNGTFTLSTTGEGGDGAVLYRVPENNGVLMVNGDQATIVGVGTVTVIAAKAESDNYKAATATGKITIEKAPAPTINYPAAGGITYGQKLSDSVLTGGSTEYGTFAWENGSTIPTVDNTGYTVVFTAGEETKKNYETITNTTQNVPVKVDQAVPAVSITAAVSGSKDDRQAVITVNVAKAGAGVFPTGTVTFIDCTDGTEIGTATLTGGSATCTWEGLQDKEYTVRAVYAGNNNYMEAESRELTFDAAKQNQQDFALDAIGAKTYGDTAITLKTTGGSGSGAVRYESSDENVIRIENDRAVIVGAGTATVTAIKEGDDNYNEASAGRNVTVAKKALTVKADSRTVVRGNPMPAFTYRADGLVNGDTFTAAPSITAGAQNTDTLGKYDIVISGGTLQNSGSYRITYVNGTLNIVEHIYTVTVTDGTGGGEYAEGDTVVVTANERNGYTFTGWSSGDGVAFADSKAKTTTFTMPARSVTVKANYISSSGGSNGGGSGDGGNSGGSGNNGGGGGTNPGNGNTAPQISVVPPAENISPGNKTTLGTGSGSGAGTFAQGTKQPFIKGEDGRTGWDVIRAKEEKAQEGSTINVDMNGAVVVPGDIFDSIKGKDIAVNFDMGNGILWSVDGKSVTTDRAGDIDFSVKTGVNTVPVDIVNNVTGESYSIQISLAYEGEFGFTAVLSIGLGKENAGYTASLYYYNENTGELEFICADGISADGTVSLAFTHASDYVIAIDGGGEEESDSAEPAQQGASDTDSAGEAESPGAGQPWWIVAVVLLAIAIGTGVVAAKKFTAANRKAER